MRCTSIQRPAGSELHQGTLKQRRSKMYYRSQHPWVEAQRLQDIPRPTSGDILVTLQAIRLVEVHRLRQAARAGLRPARLPEIRTEIADMDGGIVAISVLPDQPAMSGGAFEGISVLVLLACSV